MLENNFEWEHEANAHVLPPNEGDGVDKEKLKRLRELVRKESMEGIDSTEPIQYLLFP